MSLSGFFPPFLRFLSQVLLFHCLPFFDFPPQPRMLLQCVEAAAEEKSCSYPVYFFLSPVGLVYHAAVTCLPLEACSPNGGSARTALPFLLLGQWKHFPTTQMLWHPVTDIWAA